MVATSFSDASQAITLWKWVTSGSTAGISYPAWAFYTPAQTDGGKAYAATKGYDFLTTINAGEGFWVNAKTDFTTPLPADTAVQASSLIPALATLATTGGTHALPKGWNLIAMGDQRQPGAACCGFGHLSRNATNGWPGLYQPDHPVGLGCR